MAPRRNPAGAREVEDPLVHGGRALRALSNVPVDEEVVLVRIDLAGDEAEPLLERGIVPGCRLCPVHYASGHGPIVCRVDGSLVALRREMATCLCVRSAQEAMGLLEAN